MPTNLAAEAEKGGLAFDVSLEKSLQEPIL
jgi:hypothetical protein